MQSALYAVLCSILAFDILVYPTGSVGCGRGNMCVFCSFVLKPSTQA